MAMDAWVWIPFIMILLLAGLQAMPKEVLEAAKVDGASALAVVLADHLPADAAGQRHRRHPADHLRAEARRHRHQRHGRRPGRRHRHGSSFIYREYRDRSNVGYGTMLAEFYLVLIIVFVTAAAEPRQPLDAEAST